MGEVGYGQEARIVNTCVFSITVDELLRCCCRRRCRCRSTCYSFSCSLDSTFDNRRA